jgi:hypothetical protein
MAELPVWEEAKEEEDPYDTLIALPSEYRTNKNRLFLAVADTIHDFWDGYRGIDNDDAKKSIRASIEAILETKDVKCKKENNEKDYGITLQRCLLGLNQSKRGQFNVTTNEIEDRTIEYFESLGLPSRTKILRYEEIVINNDTLDNIDVLEIVKGKVDPKKGIDLKPVADFILNFLVGSSYKTKYTRFTFDMAQAMVGAIFRNHPQVKGLITPMNIADSATTNLEKLGLELDDYLFPKSQGSNYYESERNLLSKDSYQIQLEERGNSVFSGKTPFNFDYIVKREGVEVRGHFGDDVKQGTSLNELLKLHLHAKEGLNYTPITSKTLSVNFNNIWGGIKKDISSNESSIFLNMKRGGDQDQVDGAYIANLNKDRPLNVVMVTGDRLCALASRLRGQMTILQNSYNVKVYRARALTDAQKQELEEKYNDFKDNIIKEVIQQKNELKGKLTQFLNSISESGPNKNNQLSTKIYYSKMKDIKGQLNKIINNFLTDQLKEDTIINKMDDLGLTINSLQELITLEATFNPQMEIDFLRYYPSQFEQLEGIYKTLYDAVNSKSRLVRSMNYEQELNKSDGFISIAKLIIDGIKEVDIRNKLINSVNETFNNIPGDFGSFRTSWGILGSNSSSSSSSSALAGGKIQHGGSFENRPKTELFRKVCSIAAAYVNSFYAKTNQYKVIISTIEKVKANINTSIFSRDIALATLKKLLEKDLLEKDNNKDSNFDTLQKITNGQPINKAEAVALDNLYSIYFNKVYVTENVEREILKELKKKMLTDKKLIRNIMLEIYTTWNNGIKGENISEDETINKISYFLDPKIEEDNGTISLNHNHPIRTFYTNKSKKLEKIKKKIYVNTIIALAFINDIISIKEIEYATSLFIELVVNRLDNNKPTIQDTFKDYDINEDDKWNNIPRLINTLLFYIINNSSIDIEVANTAGNATTNRISSIPVEKLKNLEKIYNIVKNTGPSEEIKSLLDASYKDDGDGDDEDDEYKPPSTIRSGGKRKLKHYFKKTIKKRR